MQLGANTVLFGGFDLETAFRQLALAGYDGIELSAIQGMSEHLLLDRWRDLVPKIAEWSTGYGLELLAIEQPSHDWDMMKEAFLAARALGIGLVNCGPGGKAGDEQSFHQSIRSLSQLTELAGDNGVTLCVKAHVGAAVHDTPTTLRLMEAIPSTSLGIDMDPSHIYRAGEDPVVALNAVTERIRHIHIRDCQGRGPGPGKPENQANGRGDIDLVGFIRELYGQGYQGPVNLEVIGAREYGLTQCSVIAAEARGHMQACLQACGAR